MDYFSYRETGTKNYLIGFLGAMSVAHNENAVRHFIIDILPLVIKKVPEAKFMIVGGGVSDELKKLESEHVIFTGRVDDVRDYLEKCKVFVCPMTFGSGIKTKNLEAMAMGLPIVTTSIGAENINAKPGTDWLVEDLDDSFADAVIELLQVDQKRIDIGQNGSVFVRENFTWNFAKNQFLKMFSANE